MAAAAATREAEADAGSTSGKASERSSVRSVVAGGETEGARRKAWGKVGSMAGGGGGLEGKPAKLKLCLRRGGRWDRERPVEEDDEGDEAFGRACAWSSSLLCTKWHRMP